MINISLYIYVLDQGIRPDRTAAVTLPEV